MSNIQKVLVISTGGTFEKVYATGSGTRNFTFPETSAVVAMLKRNGREDVQIEYDQGLAKDSLDINGDDRRRIANLCRNRRQEMIVVIHGTDTMIDTASEISFARLNKVVVLTGSLLPACVRDSDAEQNFASALCLVGTLQCGVYICMNTRVFRWNECRKNPTTGLFEYKG